MSNYYHIPAKDKWEFDAEVTDIFEDMLNRSIPQYSVMRETITDLLECFIDSEPIIDLGCSKGQQIQLLLDRYGTGRVYHGIEISDPMLEYCRTRFKDIPNVRIHKLDLRREWLEIDHVSVCLSILTLQFIPIEYRQYLLSKIYSSLRTGGIFILVEKIIGSTTLIDNLMVQMYYDFKQIKGYSLYEIERKRLSLEGVLVPITANWNEQMLRAAGFNEVECFWRWMNFCGWLAVK